MQREAANAGLYFNPNIVKALPGSRRTGSRRTGSRVVLTIRKRTFQRFDGDGIGRLYQNEQRLREYTASGTSIMKATHAKI